MATYLQGVQDTVQAIRPPDPQLQFDAQLLATRQSKYDQAHSKLSKMYGTILNSGLTRDDNIAAREEFFKLIESDLHKIAGMDLSKDSNVSKAQNVFKQVYQNDFLVKDMVWTKNYQTEMQRAQDFRNCKDSEKCGGEYWDDGVKYMQYKREEFKNASQRESMNFDNVRYIPYNNMMNQAMKDLKESGLNIKMDQKDGKYIVTTQNGELLRTPMTQLFQGLYTKNPDFHDMYKVMAYNGRKDAIKEMVASGEYESEEAAGVAYVKNEYDAVKQKMDKFILDSKGDRQMLQDKYDAYQLDLAEGRLDENEIAEMNAIEVSLKASNQLDVYLKRYEFAQKNMNRQSNMNILFDAMDEMSGGSLLLADIDKSVNTLMFKDYSLEMDADKFELEQVKFEYQVRLEGIKQKGRESLERLKASLDTGKTEDLLKQQDYLQKWKDNKNKQENFNPGAAAIAKLQEDTKGVNYVTEVGLTEDMTWQEVDQVLNTYRQENQSADSKGKVALVEQLVNKAKNEEITLRKAVNSEAMNFLKAGGNKDNVAIDYSVYDEDLIKQAMQEDVNGNSAIQHMPAEGWRRAFLENTYAEEVNGVLQKAEVHVGRVSGNIMIKDANGQWYKEDGTKFTPASVNTRIMGYDEI
jgi:hypothetical protein